MVSSVPLNMPSYLALVLSAAQYALLTAESLHKLRNELKANAQAVTSSLSDGTHGIDSIRTEYFDNGTTCERSPRDWARSLQLDDQYQGIDLANGAADSRAVLIAPAEEVADFAKEQLRLYEIRQ
jgi:hypothetical protein